MICKVNGFTEIISQQKLLRTQVIGKDFYSIDTLQSDGKTKLRIDIQKMNKATITCLKKHYLSNKVGYYSINNDTYYRNCNVIASLTNKQVFYKGVLPNSYLAITLSNNDNGLYVNIKATESYKYESRSRLTYNNSFEKLLNNLILISSIELGYMPFHASALWSGKESYLFMGLPNTGKTTTAKLCRDICKGKMVTEDIAFIDISTLRVMGAPYTNINNLHPDIWSSPNLRRIFYLNYSENANNQLHKVEDENKTMMYLMNMNMYEFHWNEDIVIKSLMISGLENGFISQFGIEQKYQQGIAKISKNIELIHVQGMDRKNWPESISTFISKEE